MKKFEISWSDYSNCYATVEAESKEEAEEKWSNGEYTDFVDDPQSIDDVEICEQTD